MNTTARQIALLSLCRYEREGKYSNLEADAAIKKFALEGAEKKLYTKLLYGTIEKKLTLDYIISKLSDRRPEDLSLQMKNILRMSIYQMRYLDKIPDNAAVNEGVELAKKFEKPTSASFANAVLRRYTAERDRIKMPDKSKDPIKYLSIVYSVGSDVVNALVDSLGYEQTEKMLEYLDTAEHYITLRVNTLKTTPQALCDLLNENNIKAQITKTSHFGVNVESYVDITTLMSLVGELAFVEDEASQIAIDSLGCTAGDTLIDVCAAPGGKTVSAAIQMGDDGDITAFDLHENKLKLITKAAERMGVTIISTAKRDGKVSDETLHGKADRVICDVPCSNLGVLGKKPEIRYKDLSDIDALVNTQYAILSSSAHYVKKGGCMLYSTCTIDKRENGDNIRRFLAERQDFSLVKEKTLTPHTDNCDGFYIAVLTRK